MMRKFWPVCVCLLLDACGFRYGKYDEEVLAWPRGWSSEAPSKQPMQAPASMTPSLDELARGAERGDPVAEYRLAFQLPEVPVRRYWYCRSASQSHEFQDDAFLWLGILSEDVVAAYGWYALAAQHGNTEASAAISKVDKTLTTEEIQAAKRKAANWKPGDCGELPIVRS